MEDVEILKKLRVKNNKKKKNFIKKSYFGVLIGVGKFTKEDELKGQLE